MGKYQIIYADPPWQYQDKSKSHGGGADSHYKTMSIEEICQLPISDISEDNSVLLIWVTMPFLEEVFKVIKAWGFKYKTCAFTWVKTTKNGSTFMGMGRHTRQNAELCLLAVKGKGLTRENAGIRNTQHFQKGVHSYKPIQFRALIESLYGEKSRVELFARSSSNGWHVWGNEVKSDIKLPEPSKKEVQ